MNTLLDISHTLQLKFTAVQHFMVAQQHLHIIFAFIFPITLLHAKYAHNLVNCLNKLSN